MKQNRRQFIRRSLQGVALASLLGLSGSLVLRKNETGNESCDYDFICKNCRRLKSCKVPEAKKFRKKQEQVK